MAVSAYFYEICLIRRLLQFWRRPERREYGGVTLWEWMRRLHYRNEARELLAGAAPKLALNEALQTHGKGEELVAEGVGARALGELGKRHGHGAVGILALAAIAASEGEDVEKVEVLSSFLKGDAERRGGLRIYAAGCLYRIGTPTALAAILDGGPYASGIERAVLWRMRGERLVEYTAAMARFIQRNRGYYKHFWIAQDGLAEVGEAALPVIRELLKDRNAKVRQHGLGILFRMGESAMPLREDLRTMLLDEEAEIRCGAAGALLRNCGSEEGLPVVLALAGDKSAAVRQTVAWTLLRFRHRSVEACEVLRRYERDADEEVRNVASTILTK
jgi:hypothetical protein